MYKQVVAVALSSSRGQSLFRMLQEHVVYSGDDSCSFKGWDTRASAEQIFCNRSGHGAGVCCIQSHPTHEFQVATGSYDEHLRVWDLRNTTVPLMREKVCCLHVGIPFRLSYCLQRLEPLFLQIGCLAYIWTLCNDCNTSFRARMMESMY